MTFYRVIVRLTRAGRSLFVPLQCTRVDGDAIRAVTSGLRKGQYMKGSTMVNRWGMAVWLLVAGAAGVGMAQAAPERAMRQQWADSPVWHAMLYYRDGWMGSESEADDPAFFLSPEGKTDPLAELDASLAAFAQAGPQGDAHPQCRFPARYHWLKQVAGPQLQGVADQPCPAFAAFEARMAARGVTMVYPVPNMDDVSTLFGHSFLRLDRDVSPEADKYDDYTLNFAALMKKEYGQSDLVTKGLSGELEGIFTVLPYRKKLKEYLRMESRDVWEYRLNLSQEETGQLVRHAWEMRTAHFEYKFFAENCSYRMLNFLDVARPGLSLHDQYSVYVIPLDAVETVIDAGLVNNVHYQPSEASRWSAVADSLSEEELAQFHAGQLPASRMAPAAAVPHPLQPGEVGHYSARVLLSGGEREGVSVAELRVRPAYHDFLDAPTGGPLAEITVLELAARQLEGQSVELTDLTFFAASSLKARDALYSPWSWRLSTGVTGLRWLENSGPIGTVTAAQEEEAFLQALEGSDWINPLYARLLLGPAWGNRDIAFYQLFGAEVQAAGEFAHGGEALAVWNPGIVARSEAWQAQLEMQVREPADADRDTYGVATASLTRRLSNDVAAFVRATREKDVLGLQNEAQLGMAVYF